MKLTYTDRLSEALRLFGASRGHLQLDVRCYDGFLHEQHSLQAADGVPIWLLDRLLNNRSVRVAPWTTQAAEELCLAYIVWRPETRHADRHEVTEAGRAHVTEQIGTLPLPSIVVDGGHEIWAGWRLETPLRDQAAAAALLRDLAARAGGDPKPVKTLPLAGIVRNWNRTPPDAIAIVGVDHRRSYSLDSLQTVPSEDSDHGIDTAPPRSDARRRVGQKAKHGA